MAHETAVASGDESVDAICVRLDSRAVAISEIAPRIEQRKIVRSRVSQVIVELRSVGLNYFDLRAASGLFPDAQFPRTPGRDYAGVVIAGPSEWIGAEVFGASNVMGVFLDGTHASHVVLDAATLVRKPANLTFEESAGISLPFGAAASGLQGPGRPEAGDTALIYPITHAIGHALAQICAWRGVRVIGALQSGASFHGFTCAPVELVDPAVADVPTQVAALTGGRGADFIFNLTAQDAHKSLAPRGRQVFFWTGDKTVQPNIAEFFKGQHSYVGARLASASDLEISEILRELVPGFESGKLRPFEIADAYVFPLSQAARAYAAVAAVGPSSLVMFDPQR